MTAKRIRGSRAMRSQVALVMGKIGLINGEAELQDCLPRTPAHSTFSARVANLGAPIEAASTI